MFIQGYILTSEIDGTIQMKSYLTGNPEIRLALNEELSIGRGGRSIYGISQGLAEMTFSTSGAFKLFVSHMWNQKHGRFVGVF